jgi:hypoxanthine phosphoribosyltransferase
LSAISNPASPTLSPQPIPNPARSISSDHPQYSHPAEELFARILDFYGVEWHYEPTTFPLEWDEQGRVTEAFSPDFYLPGQDLYIELTTLRPQLATFKNRRLRRMQELYPQVHVKLLKRRELRAMLVKYGLVDEAARISGTAAQKPARTA